jgi:hypothetical protein
MAAKKKPRKPRKSAVKGRPKIVIDLRQLEALAAIHCNFDEMAAVIGCSRRLLLTRMKEEGFQLAVDNAKLKGKVSLRRLQWRHANGVGSAAVNMTVHLSKHWLGETDKAAIELSGPGGKTLAFRMLKEDEGL